MGIEDIQISEELETNAPSIKYRGDEGPKSPQQMQEMMMAQLEEEYLKYVDEMIEMGREPMSMQQLWIKLWPKVKWPVAILYHKIQQNQ